MSVPRKDFSCQKDLCDRCNDKRASEHYMIDTLVKLRCICDFIIIVACIICFLDMMSLFTNWHCQDIMHCPIISLKLFAVPLGTGYRGSDMKGGDPGFTWLQFYETIDQAGSTLNIFFPDSFWSMHVSEKFYHDMGIMVILFFQNNPGWRSRKVHFLMDEINPNVNRVFLPLKCLFGWDWWRRRSDVIKHKYAITHTHLGYVTVICNDQSMMVYTMDVCQQSSSQ